MVRSHLQTGDPEWSLDGDPEWSLDAKDWYWLADGFAIPRAFTVLATAPGRTARVEVEIVAGKARARSITVATDASRGLSWTVLSGVPIREILARGALNLLRYNEVQENGTTKLAPFTLPQAREAYALLEQVVGYTGSEELSQYPEAAR